MLLFVMIVWAQNPLHMTIVLTSQADMITAAYLEKAPTKKHYHQVDVPYSCRQWMAYHQLKSPVVIKQLEIAY